MRNHNVKINVMKRHQITNAIYGAAIATGVGMLTPNHWDTGYPADGIDSCSSKGADPTDVVYSLFLTRTADQL
jgi:hypothetical protein